MTSKMTEITEIKDYINMHFGDLGPDGISGAIDVLNKQRIYKSSRTQKQYRTPVYKVNTNGEDEKLIRVNVTLESVRLLTKEEYAAYWLMLPKTSSWAIDSFGSRNYTYPDIIEYLSTAESGKVKEGFGDNIPLRPAIEISHDKDLIITSGSRFRIAGRYYTALNDNLLLSDDIVMRPTCRVLERLSDWFYWIKTEGREADWTRW